MDSKTIIEVLDTLIGATNPIGDTWVDEERMENLKKLVDVTNWCLDGFLRVKEAPYMGERSIGDAKVLAQSAMQEWRDWLTEMLGE